MSSAAILVRDLKKSYGSVAAVNGVDLEVPRGTFFGFLGPNGAGKSTTIRILTGLIPADSGSVEILGLRLPEDEIEIKRRIGLVPDESLLFDRLTGAEFLEFVGRMYGLGRATAIDRANGLLDLLELPVPLSRGACLALHRHGVSDRLRLSGMQEATVAEIIGDDLANVLAKANCLASPASNLEQVPV